MQRKPAVEKRRAPGERAQAISYLVEITLTEGLATLVREKVRSGRYADESDVMRDALRALEQRDEVEPPALEAALLEGVRSVHPPTARPHWRAFVALPDLPNETAHQYLRPRRD